TPIESNVYFAGTGGEGHTWFIQEVSYRGNCSVTANSGINTLTCVGSADNPQSPNQSISSSFVAKLESGGECVPVSRFTGRGNARTGDFHEGVFGIDFVPTDCRISVFGSKVSTSVTAHRAFSF